jgi:GNAT superfamily N-acetyltransferase
MTTVGGRPEVGTRGLGVATAVDIPALNELFTEAFTDRYRRDGMAGVRVPPLHPQIWRYAIEDAGEGALCWRDGRGRLVAFNMVHRSGAEGWMGPLCVRPDQQGSGIGKQIVTSGLHWLRARGARVIGLETMPRTMDNIGFYSRLGFVPGALTVTLTLEVGRTGDAAASIDSTPPSLVLSRMPASDQRHAVAACRTLTGAVQDGYDFSRELELTVALGLGDVVLLGPPAAPAGFALYHTTPLVEGRSRDEVRVLKLVLARREDFPLLLDRLMAVTRQEGVRRLAVRMQGEYPDAYQAMLSRGARVRWTDLRMCADGGQDQVPSRGLVLSNWEI